MALHRGGGVCGASDILRSEEVSPPIPANDGFDAAEEDLCGNVEGLIKRFETWHGVKDRSNL
ncbi:hypothetical protein BRC87_02515 [Halobacteriales archaeon QS_4_66_20]|nr:MAG: hypothetical protein BRC87_02515 [Halobacteriales archaeon QS_4_66_20]